MGCYTRHGWNELTVGDRITLTSEVLEMASLESTPLPGIPTSPVTPTVGGSTPTAPVTDELEAFVSCEPKAVRKVRFQVVARSKWVPNPILPNLDDTP